MNYYCTKEQKKEKKFTFGLEVRNFTLKGTKIIWSYGICTYSALHIYINLYSSTVRYFLLYKRKTSFQLQSLTQNIKTAYATLG